MVRFFDTNILLNHFSEITEHFAISSITLSELEHIKTSASKDESVKYKCRKVTRWLEANQDLYDVCHYQTFHDDIIDGKGLEINSDSRIVACAAIYYAESNGESCFVTEDLSCKHIAKDCFSIPCQSFSADDTAVYKGYKEISGNADDINDAMSNMDLSKWYINEYLIIHNTDDDNYKEMRYDGEKFVPLRLPPSKYIKARNSLQRCALDLAMNQNITICGYLGGYGTGKTYLAMNMGLFAIEEKGWQRSIVGVREVAGEGKSVGYLPGDFEDKTDSFFAPLCQQLSGGVYEFEMLKQQGKLEFQIPYYMKGTTYSDSVLIVDEAEDLSEKQIKLVGTRLGDNSKIFFCGDYKQSVINATENNALIRMCEELKGNPKFGCIYMSEDERSETSKIFATLFTGE